MKELEKIKRDNFKAALDLHNEQNPEWIPKELMYKNLLMTEPNNRVLKEFLTHSEETGRQVVESLRTGKKYYVEAIGNGRSNWGDLDPATGKITGNYGGKYTGSITKEQSVITEENGFHNIVTIDSGSPYGVILEMDSKYPNKETS